MVLKSTDVMVQCPFTPLHPAEHGHPPASTGPIRIRLRHAMGRGRLYLCWSHPPQAKHMAQNRQEMGDSGILAS